MRGFAECGSWQKMQLSAWLVSLTNSLTFDVRLHFAPGTGSPMYAQSRMWSCVLQDMQTGFAAAAVPGLNTLCGSPGYLSTMTSQTLKLPPGCARPRQPSLFSKRPPNARSTTYWS